MFRPYRPGFLWRNRSWAFSPSYHIAGLQPANAEGPKACHVIARAEGPGRMATNNCTPCKGDTLRDDCPVNDDPLALYARCSGFTGRIFLGEIVLGPSAQAITSRVFSPPMQKGRRPAM